jgi:hypothetical protein
VFNEPFRVENIALHTDIGFLYVKIFWYHYCLLLPTE